MATLVQTIRKLRSPDGREAVKAVEELRARGWLEDGSLDGVRLCHVHLDGADLFKAVLRKIDFHQAHFADADLSGADLSGTEFARADMRGVNFSGANLEGTDFLKANLSGAINLIEEQLSQAKRLTHATMPDGKPYDGRYRLPADLELAKWGKVDTEDDEAMAYFLGVSVETYQEGQKLAAKTAA
ncbi:MAG: pentapeptide repeat-containing protein [Anaerolineales bacterium]|nr:pentapeptide repeat-containing protein [Anaerolineales bacterium]